MDKGHKRIWGDDRTVIHLDYSDGCMSVSVKSHRTVRKNDEFHCVKNRPVNLLCKVMAELKGTDTIILSCQPVETATWA